MGQREQEIRERLDDFRHFFFSLRKTIARISKLPDDMEQLLNRIEELEKALKEIKKTYDESQPNHEGEVMYDSSDVLDAIYEIAQNALKESEKNVRES